MLALKKIITLGAVAAFLLLLGCQGPVTLEPQPAKPPSSSKTKLIVFVHGYRGDASTWSKFEKLVQEDDTLREFEVHPMHYPTSILWKSPPERQLGELLGTELVERFGAYREIYLIGHSMGGLVICSMVVEKLKAGKAQDLKKIKHIILFGTPNNGAQIPRLLSWWDRQLADLSSSEHFVDELRNELINRVYHPRISPGDENSKLPIPVTVVIGLQDQFVDEASARSFFRDPQPLTVPGDHQSMKEPDNRDSLAYLVVRNKLLSSRKPDKSSPPLAESQDIQPTKKQIESSHDIDQTNTMEPVNRSCFRRTLR